jgi:hypothetical protein
LHELRPRPFVGILEEVAPRVLLAFGIEVREGLLPGARQALLGPPRGSSSFVTPPSMPDMERMLSFSAHRHLGA